MKNKLFWNSQCHCFPWCTQSDRLFAITAIVTLAGTLYAVTALSRESSSGEEHASGILDLVGLTVGAMMGRCTSPVWRDWPKYISNPTSRSIPSRVPRFSGSFLPEMKRSRGVRIKNMSQSSQTHLHHRVVTSQSWSDLDKI